MVGVSLREYRARRRKVKEEARTINLDAAERRLAEVIRQVTNTPVAPSVELLTELGNAYVEVIKA